MADPEQTVVSPLPTRLRVGESYEIFVKTFHRNGQQLKVGGLQISVTGGEGDLVEVTDLATGVYRCILQPRTAGYQTYRYYVDSTLVSTSHRQVLPEVRRYPCRGCWRWLCWR